MAGAEVVVGGFAASNVDTQHELLRRFPETVGLELSITAIMLFLAFRSLLVPLKAVLLNCLSVGAAFGLTVLVFQHGYGGGGFCRGGAAAGALGGGRGLGVSTLFGLSSGYAGVLFSPVKDGFLNNGGQQRTPRL